MERGRVLVLGSLLCLGVSWLGFGGSAVTVHAGESFAVIVNSGNTYNGSLDEMKDSVAKVFLKQRQEWPGGLSSKPYDRPKKSKEHIALLSTLLKINEAKLAEHWVKLKQLRGETAPRVIRPDKITISLVGKDKGAMAVVKASALKGLSNKVKVLFEF
jgi:hypothetical protein